MGAPDYVNSKEAIEAGKFQAGKFAQRHLKVGVRSMALAESSRSGGGMHQENRSTQGDDMFDTDVEALDESTIDDTSVFGADEHSRPDSSAQNLPKEPTERLGTGPPLNNQRPPQQQRRRAGRRWGENLGSEALKKAGFESEDDVDTDVSQPTSTDGEEKENEWQHQLDNKPLGLFTRQQQLRQQFLNAQPRSLLNDQPIMGLSPSLRNPEGPVQDRKKATLPRSIGGAAPRTHFHQPKPSLLEQLSPSHRTTSVPQQTGRGESLGFHAGNNNGAGNDQGARRDNSPGASVISFDENEPADLDNSRDRDGSDRDSTQSAIQDSPSHLQQQRKRPIEPDYPPHILYQKPFSNLQAEPFDYTPSQLQSTDTAAATATVPPTVPQETAQDKVKFAFGLTDEERRSYFSKLSMREWEECGDELLSQFSTMLEQAKGLRQARRNTAAVFETEIKRRHDKAEQEAAELSKKMDGMRDGGAEVLRGLDPADLGGQPKT